MTGSDTHNPAPKKRYKKWPGLKAAAKVLEVNYAHLRRVVAGKVISPDLLKRYNQTFGDEGEQLQTIQMGKKSKTA
jgi:hypothetical protein